MHRARESHNYHEQLLIINENIISSVSEKNIIFIAKHKKDYYTESMKKLGSNYRHTCLRNNV